MDFGSVLYKAQKNETNKKEPVRYYSTKFEPPKKEQKKKQLSVNIQKFLAKKEMEEKKKQEEALKKREELLALRAKDKKATKRVNVMLKRTKSANQSVIQDAVDEDNTAVTLAGPSQPDEDDYGYVSQEASAFYNKMMEKYNKMPDEPKFPLENKRVSTNLKSTKERVKAALEKEREEANMPHKRKRKHKEKDDDDQNSRNEEKEEEMTETKKEPKKEKPKFKPAPAINFNDLLKLAEKKQHEPIVIEAKPKEDEVLLTKKQKKEQQRELESRERRENRSKNLNTSEKNPAPQSIKPNSQTKPINNSIKSDPKPKEAAPKTSEIPKKAVDKKQNDKPNTVKTSTDSNREQAKQRVLDVRKNDNLNTSKKGPLKSIPRNDVASSNTKATLHSKNTLPAKTNLPNQPNFNRPPNSRPYQPAKKPSAPMKRRILDDDYDSEMDDFIDDGDNEEEDVSKYISEIFGYNKSKYRYDEDDIDDMESSFAQQMKEEVFSTKIGIMEDLEDMRQEEQHKKRKAQLKKKFKSS